MEWREISGVVAFLLTQAISLTSSRPVCLFWLYFPTMPCATVSFLLLERSPVCLAFIWTTPEFTSTEPRLRFAFSVRTRVCSCGHTSPNTSDILGKWSRVWLRWTKQGWCGFTHKSSNVAFILEVEEWTRIFLLLICWRTHGDLIAQSTSDLWIWRGTTVSLEEFCRCWITVCQTGCPTATRKAEPIHQCS